MKLMKDKITTPIAELLPAIDAYHRVRITCPDCGESAYVETDEKFITENPWWETRCKCREWSLVIVAEGEALDDDENKEK